ncbi:hypothetical protein SUGI_1156010 [Cryptomeria japonica]|nr:hypothetical protein SUGI_1156010 [Cryptomeria japonica]
MINGKQRKQIQYYNEWDRSMEKNWLLVTPAQLPKLSVKKGNRKHIRWKAPPVGWLKLNFDGACRGNPGVSSFGAVICNSEGIPHGTVTFDIHSVSEPIRDLIKVDHAQ